METRTALAWVRELESEAAIVRGGGRVMILAPAWLRGTERGERLVADALRALVDLDRSAVA